MRKSSGGNIPTKKPRLVPGLFCVGEENWEEVSPGLVADFERLPDVTVVVIAPDFFLLPEAMNLVAVVFFVVAIISGNFNAGLGSIGVENVDGCNRAGDFQIV
jgi:hypothetical protein